MLCRGSLVSKPAPALQLKEERPEALLEAGPCAKAGRTQGSLRPLSRVPRPQRNVELVGWGLGETAPWGSKLTGQAGESGKVREWTLPVLG